MSVLALDGDSTMTRVFPEASEAPDIPLDADAFEADALVRVRLAGAAVLVFSVPSPVFSDAPVFFVGASAFFADAPVFFVGASAFFADAPFFFVGASAFFAEVSAFFVGALAFFAEASAFFSGASVFTEALAAVFWVPVPEALVPRLAGAFFS